MGILTWIALGLVAGVLAKFLMPGKGPGGLVITILLGIAGALVGGLISSAVGFGTVGGFDIRSIIIAVVGALILLGLYRFIRRR